MRLPNRKIIKILSSALAMLFLLIGYTVYSQQDRQNLEVDFLDVGQGDAILIKTPFEQNVLIDGGPDNKVLAELGSHLAFFDKELDLVILTHPHSDHVDGLVEVLRRYKVDKVMMTGVVNTAPDYMAFLDEIKKQNIPVEIAKAPDDIVLGEGLDLKILYPLSDLSGKEVEDLNNSSIVAKLTYKNNTFLLTGDAGEIVELELIQNNIDLKSELLKVGHHGSKYASSLDFLKKVNPQYAIIQVGKDNDFGHPHLRALDNLQKIGAEIWRTDLQGTIIAISDGNFIKIKAGK